MEEGIFKYYTHSNIANLFERHWKTQYIVNRFATKVAQILCCRKVRVTSYLFKSLSFVPTVSVRYYYRSLV